MAAMSHKKKIRCNDTTCQQPLMWANLLALLLSSGSSIFSIVCLSDGLRGARSPSRLLREGALRPRLWRLRFNASLDREIDRDLGALFSASRDLDIERDRGT